MKTVRFYSVWKRDVQYLSTPSQYMEPTFAESFGFDLYEPKGEGIPNQWYIEKPNKKQLPVLIKALEANKVKAKVVKYEDNKSESLGWDLWEGYNFGHKPCPEMKKIAEKLIKTDASHKHLTAARIKYVFKKGRPSEDEHGRYDLAFVQLAPKIARNMGKWDFIMTTYESVLHWLEEVHKIRLVDHELCHLQFKGSPYLIGHDIEEFTHLYKKYKVKLGEDLYSGKDDLIRNLLESDD